MSSTSNQHSGLHTNAQLKVEQTSIQQQHMAKLEQTRTSLEDGTSAEERISPEKRNPPKPVRQPVDR